MKQYRYPCVLTIAGSDSGGGAGIQADLKTFSALGCYGTTAITAVTVQNTMGVNDIHSIPGKIVEAQIIAIMEDIKPVAIKIGMVHSEKLALTIATVLKSFKDIPIIFDPVMVSTSGHKLIEEGTIATLKNTLFPLAAIVTPNLDEAMLLTDMAILSLADMKKAVSKIIKTGCKSVLIKGGHLKGTDLYDVYLDQSGHKQIFKSKAINSINTHGTGCTLSSAITSFIARDYDMLTAVDRARTYIYQAIECGKDVKTGNGHGPLNHFFDPKKMIKYELE